MILRSWSARADAQGAEAYRRHFTGEVLPQLERLAGYRGAYLLRRDRGDEVELQVLSVWDSPAAVERFAGPDVERAVVAPDARAVLTGYDATVSHYTVVEEHRPY
jgi:heme-degrading monooxygenase HmoA